MADLHPNSTPEPVRPRLSPETLSRIAEQVAGGLSAMPEGLDPDQQQDLIVMTQQCTRDRLIRFIARVIAQELSRDGKDARRKEGR